MNCTIVSAGCNDVSKALVLLDYEGYSSFAFAVDNSIICMDLVSGSLLRVLNGHSDRVNCTSLLSSLGKCTDTEIVSGGADGRVIIWNLQSNAKPVQLCSENVSISCISSLSRHNRDKIVVSSDTSGTVRIWMKADDGSIDWPSAFVKKMPVSKNVECIRLTEFTKHNKESCAMLALGCVDYKIHLFTVSNNSTNHSEVILTEYGSLSGHQDWVKSLSFSRQTVDGCIYLASASSDTYIRIWRIWTTANAQETKLEETAPDDDVYIGDVRLSVPDSSGSLFVSLDSVISGHSDTVTDVFWCDNMVLISASFDRTCRCWQIDLSTKLWTLVFCLGNAKGVQLGGPLLKDMIGVLCCVASSDCKNIITSGYGGSLHFWKCGNDNEWKEYSFLTGHAGSVLDLCWHPDGNYLISASSDQSCRLYGEVAGLNRWFELNRVQIHGNDINTVHICPNYPYRIASGSEEKMIRILEGTLSSIKAIHDLCSFEPTDVINPSDRAPSAYIQALNLTNKAKSQTGQMELSDLIGGGLRGDDDDEDGENAGEFNRQMLDEVNKSEVDFLTTGRLSEPLIDRELSKKTLWVETMKLYGHRNEIMCLRYSNRGDVIVSSCKSKIEEARKVDIHPASLIVWDGSQYHLLGYLIGHTSTVVGLDFSHDDEWLVSCGKDRQLIVYKRVVEQCPYRVASIVPNAHARIIWGCSWSCDGRFIGTVSRDGNLAIWTIGLKTGSLYEAEVKKVASFFPRGNKVSITSLEFSPHGTSCNSYVIALGYSDGVVGIYAFDAVSLQISLMHESSGDISHGSEVSKVRWRPRSANQTMILQLATCSADHTVRLYNVALN